MKAVNILRTSKRVVGEGKLISFIFTKGDIILTYFYLVNT